MTAETAATVSAIAAVLAAAFAFTSWRVARSVSPPVRWTVTSAAGPAKGLHVYRITNAGTGTARKVTATLEPKPRTLGGSDDGSDPRDVHRGGIVEVTCIRAWGQEEPHTLTVQWRRLWFLTGRWSTAL